MRVNSLNAIPFVVKFWSLLAVDIITLITQIHSRCKSSLKKKHITLNEKSILSVNTNCLILTEWKWESKVFILSYDYFALTLCPKAKNKIQRKAMKNSSENESPNELRVITDGRTETDKGNNSSLSS